MTEEKNFLKFTHAEKVVNNNGAFGGIYFLAFVGSLIYFLQQAGSFWEVVIGFVKAIFWPAVVMYEVLSLLKL